MSMVDVPANKTLFAKARTRSMLLSRPSQWSNTTSFGLYYHTLTIAIQDAISLTSLIDTIVHITGPITRTLSTNEQGVVTVEDIPEGTYTLTCSKSGYLENTDTVELYLGQQVTRVIELEPIAKSTIVGMVKDVNTKLILANANVTLQGDGINKTTTSDSSGVFTFLDIYNGHYTLRATATNYQQGEQLLIIEGRSQTLTPTIELLPVPKSTISGIVRDSNTQQPIMQSTVQLTGTNINVTLTTNLNGIFTLDNLLPGNYNIQITKAGYIAKEESITVGSGVTVEPIFLLDSIPKATLGGTVQSNSTGLSLQGVSLLLVKPGVSKSLITDISGNYYWDNLDTGSYTLTASLTDYFPYSTTVNITLPTDYTKNIALEPEPPPTGDLSGIVKDARTLQPLSGATVNLTRDTTTLTTTTNSIGRYSFSDLVSGNYTLLGHKLFTHLEASTTLAITAGAYINRDLLLPQAPGELLGTVRDRITQLPLANVTITLTGPSGTINRTTNSTGTYSATDLISGTYVATYRLTNYMDSTANIEVPMGSSVSHTHDMDQSLGHITGTVRSTSASGIVLPNATLTISNGTVSKSTTSDSNGNFIISDLLAGAYTLNTTLTNYQPSSFNVNIVAASTVNTTVILQENLKILTGRIFNSVTQQLITSRTDVDLNKPDWIGFSQSTLSGRYTFTDVPSGDYSLGATCANYNPYTDTVIIDIDHGTVTKDIYLVPTANSVLQGRVTDAITGQGVVGAYVQATVNGITRTTYTDSTGNYQITAIPAGSCQVVLTGSGYISLVDVTTLSFSETKTINYILSPTMDQGWRYVLSWNEYPRDLDAHLILPDGSVISYRNKGSDAHAILDRDTTTGYGPETITVAVPRAGIYRYRVHCYSTPNNMVNTYAVVRMFGPTGLLGEWTAPTTGSGVYWNVCAYELNGIITVQNTLTNS
jgi:hypothetical protein